MDDHKRINEQKLPTSALYFQPKMCLFERILVRVHLSEARQWKNERLVK